MSTFSTLLDVRTRTRGYLREAEAVQWTDDILDEHISQAHQETFDEIRQVRGPGWGVVREDVQIPAATERYDLGGLTQDFESLGAIWHVLSSGVVVPMGEISPENQDYTFTTDTWSADTTPGYYRESSSAGEFIVVRQKSSGIRTLRIKYRFQVSALVNDANELQTPSRYDPLVARRAQQLALMDISETNGAVDVEIQRLSAMMIEREVNAAAKDTNPMMNTAMGDSFFSGGSVGGGGWW